MADKRISQLIERVDIENNDVLPIVASGASTTNKVTISTIQDWMQGHLDVGVTSVGITIGTSGNDVNVTGSPITTSGNITINIPTATSTIRGLLSASDWSTFNAKQPAGNYVTLDTTQTITAHKTFTASGGQNSITINHSSGAGHGLEITKAGNGEGLRVNKTSGSGNAATIIGTLEATTIVKTGGTSSQFLKADGSIDSSTYLTTDTTQTVTGEKTFSGSSLRLAANGTADAVVLRNVSGTTGSDSGATTMGFNGNDNIFVNTQSNGGFILAFSNTVSNRQYDLPNASGTIALTSNLSSYLPLSGGTLTGALNGTSASFSGAVTSNANEGFVISPSSGASYINFRTGGTSYSLLGVAGASNDIISGSALGDLNVRSSNGQKILFSTNNGGTAALTISSTGAATFSSSVSGSQFIANGNSAGGFEGLRIVNASTGAAQIALNNSVQSWLVNTRTDNQFSIFNSTASITPFLISTSGAATFSSSVTATGGTEIPNGQFYRARRSSGSLLTDMIGIPSGTDDVRLLTTGDYNIVNGSLTNLMTIKNGGNVGIGTASPTTYSLAGRHLEVNDAGGGFAFIHNNTTSVKSFFAANESGALAALFTFSNHPLTFGTNNTERMRVTSGGYLVLGGTSSVYGQAGRGTFEMNGSSDNILAMRVGGSLAGYLYTNASGMELYSTNPLSFSTAGSERMRITSGGFLKASNNGVYGSVAGTYHELNQNTNGSSVVINAHTGTNPYGIESHFSGADPNNASNYMFGAYTTSGGFTWIYRIFSNGTVSARSDARWKKNIETARNGYIDDLCKLRVVKYNWYNHEDDAPKELGLIAQEVEEVFPGLVQQDPVIAKREVEQEDGTIIEEEFEDGVSRSVKTSVLPFMLLKAIQEQQEQIKSLTEQVQALKSQING